MSHHGGPGIGSDIAGRPPGLPNPHRGLDTVPFQTGDAVLQWIARVALAEDHLSAGTVALGFTKVYLP
jgi:hypothetical protein